MIFLGEQMKNLILTTALCALGVSGAQAADFSYSGTFVNDNDVQRFDFSVTAASTITLRSYGYAGGTQADGTVVAAGGFDPVLTLFTGAGAFIEDQDDGSNVPADPVTGSFFDVNLEVDLDPGSYFVTITQFDNFLIGSTFDDGFTYDNQPSFRVFCATGIFCDVNDESRTGDWAFDVLNVDVATIPTDPTGPTGPNPGIVPLPAGLPLMLAGLGALAWVRRSKSKG